MHIQLTEAYSLFLFWRKQATCAAASGRFARASVSAASPNLPALIMASACALRMAGKSITRQSRASHDSQEHHSARDRGVRVRAAVDRMRCVWRPDAYSVFLFLRNKACRPSSWRWRDEVCGGAKHPIFFVFAQYGYLQVAVLRIAFFFWQSGHTSGDRRNRDLRMAGMRCVAVRLREATPRATANTPRSSARRTWLVWFSLVCLVGFSFV